MVDCARPETYAKHIEKVDAHSQSPRDAGQRCASTYTCLPCADVPFRESHKVCRIQLWNVDMSNALLRGHSVTDKSLFHGLIYSYGGLIDLWATIVVADPIIILSARRGSLCADSHPSFTRLTQLHPESHTQPTRVEIVKGQIPIL